MYYHLFGHTYRKTRALHQINVSRALFGDHHLTAMTKVFDAVSLPEVEVGE